MQRKKNTAFISLVAAASLLLAMAAPFTRASSSAGGMAPPALFFGMRRRRPFASVEKHHLSVLLQMRGGEIQYPSSMEELDSILQDSMDKLVVIDFYSNDCPPCEKVAPLYEEISLAEEFPSDKVVFLKINVEDQPMITTKYGVTGWPTFVFIKRGEVQAEVVGGKLAEATLYDWVQLLMPKDDSGGGDKNTTSSSSSSSSAKEE